MGLFTSRKSKMPEPSEALPGRATPIPTAARHHVNKVALQGPYPEGHEKAVFGLGCFWGAEKAFWSVPGVYVTAVGYAGGYTPNPTYEEVCSGRTGHNEVVLVVFDHEGGFLRRAAEAVLGRPQSDARDAPGQRYRHAIPLKHLHLFGGSEAQGRSLEGGL